MRKHTHNFIETFDGFIGYGFDRKSNEDTVKFYLQKFSDDTLMDIIINRMSDDDLDELFGIISKALKKYLSEEEYHKFFLGE